MKIGKVPNIRQRTISLWHVLKPHKLAHALDPSLQIGMMLGDDALYPASCKPEDVFANTQQMQMSLYFYSDVLLRGEYPGYALRYFYDHDIQCDDQRRGRTAVKREYRRFFIIFVLLYPHHQGQNMLRRILKSEPLLRKIYLGLGSGSIRISQLIKFVLGSLSNTNFYR